MTFFASVSFSVFLIPLLDWSVVSFAILVNLMDVDIDDVTWLSCALYLHNTLWRICTPWHCSFFCVHDWLVFPCQTCQERLHMCLCLRSYLPVTIRVNCLILCLTHVSIEHSNSHYIFLHLRIWYSKFTLVSLFNN